MICYPTLDEKTPFFAANEIVRTRADFDALNENLSSLTDNKKLHVMFRGVTEAKYKLYNSFQRLWWERRLAETGLQADACVIKMLEHCRSKDNPLSRYLKQLGVVCNDWLLLSFLQHYNAHTPLLDFSRNPQVALFFAMFNQDKHGYETEIDGFCSIYYYKTVEAGQAVPTLKKTVEPKVKRLTFSHWQTKLWDERLSFKSIIQETDVMTIPSRLPKSALRNENGETVSTFALANLNSTNQEGEFVLNMDMNHPLEEKFVKDGNRPLIHCVNIHKGLSEYIIKKYLGGSIEAARNKYFKNEYDIAREAENAFLSQG